MYVHQPGAHQTFAFIFTGSKADLAKIPMALTSQLCLILLWTIFYYKTPPLIQDKL